AQPHARHRRRVGTSPSCEWSQPSPLLLAWPGPAAFPSTRRGTRIRSDADAGSPIQEARDVWSRAGHRHPQRSGGPSDAGRIPFVYWRSYSSPDAQFATKDIAKPEKIKIPTRHGQIDAIVYKPPEVDITTAAHAGKLPPVHFITRGRGFIV